MDSGFDEGSNQSQGFLNWIRAGISIKYTKQCLEPFIDNEAKGIHKSIKDILQHSTDITGYLKKIIVLAYRLCDQSCTDSDQSKSLKDDYEVAKYYFQNTDGYTVISSAKAADCIDLLDIGVIIFVISSYHRQQMGMHGSPLLRWVPIVFHECREATKEILGNPCQSLTQIQLKKYLDVMKETLLRINDIRSDRAVKEAVQILTQLETLDFVISDDNIEEVKQMKMLAMQTGKCDKKETTKGDETLKRSSKQQEVVKKDILKKGFGFERDIAKVWKTNIEVVYRRDAVETEGEGIRQDMTVNIDRENQIKEKQKAVNPYAKARLQKDKTVIEMKIPFWTPGLLEGVKDYNIQSEQLYSRETYVCLEVIVPDLNASMLGPQNDITRGDVLLRAKSSPTTLESKMPQSYLYELPASCYPRYKYFSEHLHRFMSRFREFMEFEQFYESFSKDDYHDIFKDSSQVANMINVYLDIETEEQRTTIERHMFKARPIKKKKEVIRRRQLVSNIETDDPIRTCLQLMPHFRYGSKNTFRCLIRGFELVIYTDDDDGERESLGDVIQHILERKAVQVFEKIKRYTDSILGEIGTSGYSKDKKKRQIVERLRFEVIGILRQSKFSQTPRTPNINPDMKKDILALSGVKGCGTVLGVLTVFFSGRCENEDAIKKILQKYNCDSLEYKIETETKLSQCADNLHSTGESIRAERNTPSRLREKYGTLGCFIRQQRREENDQENNLYFITCGHCVSECNDSIGIEFNETFIPFGKTEHIIFDGYLVKDVAFVKVLRNRVNNCDTSVFRSCGSLSSRNWYFIEDNDLAGLPVYKIGAKTRITHGVVASANDLTMIMHESEGRPYATVDDFVLIVGVAGKNNASNFFCNMGDSGSIVCSDDVDHAERVKVVSLLAGILPSKRRGARDETIDVFYTFNLKRIIQDYSENYNIQYEPATEEENETNDEFEDIFEDSSMF